MTKVRSEILSSFRKAWVRGSDPANTAAVAAGGKGRIRWRRLLAVGAPAAIIAWLLLAAAGGRREAASHITAPVERGPFRVTITEGGELESSRTVSVNSKVEGFQPKVIQLLPEGSRVTRGQVVMVLDSADIQRAVAEQQIKLKQTEAKAKAAREECEIQKNKAASLVAQAQLALRLARLDKVKYMEGQYKVEVDDLKGLIALAETELQDAIATVEYYTKLVKKGFRTPEQLRGKEQAVERYKYNLNRDREKLRVLEEFTRERNEVELKAKADEAVRELARLKRSTVAEIAKVQTDFEATEATASMEKVQLERLERQLAECTIHAPADGVVVYAKEANSRIQLGAMVHYQQKLFNLPELRELQVKVYIHESVVKKVVPGLSAEIRIDAYPGFVLNGTVESVATFFDPVRYWSQGGVKEYTGIVLIKDLPDAGLKPGMTAEVTILIKELADALVVPIQAVTEVGGEYHAFVTTSEGVERRTVLIGENNDRLLEVKEGLKEGERVLLDARARVAADRGHARPKEP